MSRHYRPPTGLAFGFAPGFAPGGAFLGAGLPGGGASGILTLGWKPAIVMGMQGWGSIGLVRAFM